MTARRRRSVRSAGIGLLALFAAHLVVWPAWADDIAGKVKVCATCHGENGLPTEPDIPIIWGQQFYYLYVQLKDFKAGRRANDIMQGMVADLSKADMQALAQYFSEKKWPTTEFRASAAAIKRGQEIAVAGQCTQCHLGNYEGNSRVPRTADQQVGYLVRTMLALKNGVRLNAAAMASLMEGMSDNDIKAMAEYLAGM